MIKANIDKGKQTSFSTCPEPNCPLNVPPSFVTKLLPEQYQKRFNQFLLQRFVDENSDFTWCPAPNCQWVCESLGFKTQARCHCGYVFCVLCSEEGHLPCPCEFVVKWRNRMSDENANNDWILANTKQCPSCHKNIEKNQGCNHMTCSQCRHEFCWICLGPWSKHGSSTGGYYSCNRPIPKDSAADKVNAAKERMEYFNHYHTRYQEHNKSYEIAKKEYQSVEKKMMEYSLTRRCDIRVAEFIERGLSLVVDCRRTLKWSYVLGFYLEKSPQKEFFEFLQRDLEGVTENLNHLTEQPVSLMDRLTMLDTIAATERYFVNLLDGLEDIQAKLKKRT